MPVFSRRHEDNNDPMINGRRSTSNLDLDSQNEVKPHAVKSDEPASPTEETSPDNNFSFVSDLSIDIDAHIDSAVEKTKGSIEVDSENPSNWSFSSYLCDMKIRDQGLNVIPDPTHINRKQSLGSSQSVDLDEVIAQTQPERQSMNLRNSYIADEYVEPSLSPTIHDDKLEF